jgi:acetyl-CoA carboxylase biotin carboxyl carrier protein
MIRRIAAEVLLDVPKPPRGLRLRAGDVCLELEWPEPGPPAQVAPPGAPQQVTPNGHRPDAARHDFVAPEVKQEPERPAVTVCSPMVGVFYRAPQPGAAPFVTEGDHITSGQQVAIIEAMKLMIPVEAAHSGRITSVLVPDGHSVEYGQPLFAVDQDS